MYLSDSRIREILEDLEIECPETSPFNADEQIQPCSIDLRLDTLFWRPRRNGNFPRWWWWPHRAVLDLNHAHLLEVKPRHHWERFTIAAGGHVSLRPGELVLGRTLERFKIPDTVAGKLEGRSSFGRLGLAVHCSGDFINPGWSGHMPLVLVNHGSHTLRIPPTLEVCQLMLIQVDGRPSRTYGMSGLESKYMEDDGGPSYWWRDKRVTRLHESLERANYTLAVQKAIADYLAPFDPDVLDRATEFMAKIPGLGISNAYEVLDAFAEEEDHRRRRIKILGALCDLVFPICVAGLLQASFFPDIGPTTLPIWLLIVLTAVSLPPFVFQLNRAPSEFFGRKELQRRRNELPKE